MNTVINSNKVAYYEYIPHACIHIVKRNTRKENSLNPQFEVVEQIPIMWTTQGSNLEKQHQILPRLVK